MPKTELFLILTTDYEIFGDGSGDIQECIIRPAEELMRVCEAYECPVTFFPDMSEYLAFRGVTGEYCKAASDIENQLLRALKKGHDIQLHLHPQWEGAKLSPDGGWELNMDLWDISRLAEIPVGGGESQNLMFSILSKTKSELERLCRKADPKYKCIAFRAGGWGIRPEREVFRVLAELGVMVDSSSLPGMYLNQGYRNYDFRDLPQHIPAWEVKDDLVQNSRGSGLWEIPVFTQKVGAFKMVKHFLQRCAVQKNLDTVVERQTKIGGGRFFQILKKTAQKLNNSYLRFDYCDLNAKEMEEMVLKAEKRFSNWTGGRIPLVMAGHTKTQGSLGELDKFLNWANGKMKFGTFDKWFSRIDVD